MAYTKPFKVVQDTYATFKDWNELQDSNRDSYEQLAVKHSLANGLTTLGFGEHNDYLIPQAVVHVTVETFGALVSMSPDASIGIQSVQRLDVGLYRIGTSTLYGVTGTKVWGEVNCEAPTIATIRDARVKWNDGSLNRNTFVGFEIELLQATSSGEPVTTTWDLADYSFALTVFRGMA